MIDEAELDRRFTYHKPPPENVEKHESMRAGAHALAAMIVHTCPPCAERDQAVDLIDMALMRANAAIARPQAGSPIEVIRGPAESPPVLVSKDALGRDLTREDADPC